MAIALRNDLLSKKVLGLPGMAPRVDVGSYDVGLVDNRNRGRRLWIALDSVGFSWIALDLVGLRCLLCLVLEWAI